MSPETKRKIINAVKKFNMENFDKGMKIFDESMKEFGKAMDDLTKELNQTDGKKKPELWSKQTVSLGTGSGDIKIWPDKKTKPKKKKRNRRKNHNS